MAATITEPIIRLPEIFEARGEFEISGKGYLGQVVVQFEDGKRYELFFYDPVRMAQDLEEESKLGRPYLAEPNLILVPEVTAANIRRAVTGLGQAGYFHHLKAL